VLKLLEENLQADEKWIPSSNLDTKKRRKSTRNGGIG
jgi:hypothetical protein